MHLNALDPLALQLVAIPFYLLCLISLFCLQLHRRSTTGGIIARSAEIDHVVVYTPHHAAAVVAPLYAIFGLLLWSLRGVETQLCLSQLYLSGWAVRFTLFNWALVGGAGAIFAQIPAQTTLPYIFEFLLTLLWLFWCFFWLLLVSNLLIFLFFFEIVGLLLLIALLYLFVLASRQVGGLRSNGKLLNYAVGAKFLFMQTLLFFLWSSALSMLCLFWGSLALGSNCFSLELSLIELFYDFGAWGHNPRSSWFLVISLFTFFFAALLKGAVVPLQLWLVVFYRHLPLAGIFVYLIFYYTYFIFVLFTLLFGYLYALSGLWNVAIFILLAFGTLHALGNLSEASAFRSLLAYSSIINILTLLLLALLGGR